MKIEGGIVEAKTLTKNGGRVREKKGWVNKTLNISEKPLLISSIL